MNTSGKAVVEYTYDAWGNPLSTTGTMASTLGEANSLRYRGILLITIKLGEFLLEDHMLKNSAEKLRSVSRLCRKIGIVGEAIIVFGPTASTFFEKFVQLLIGAMPLLISYICYRIASHKTE